MNPETSTEAPGPGPAGPGNRYLKEWVTVFCTAAALITGTLALAGPATAQESPGSPATPTTSSAPAGTGSDEKSTLQEEIGDRGAFMGQSLLAKQQDIDVQELDQRRMLQTQGIETMAGSWTAPGINGLDVSGWQENVNWQEQWDLGARFAYVKATEGGVFTSDSFNRQYTGASATGMIRGAYHFALPNSTNAVSQARFFVKNGGGWTADGKTLPPLLDIEHNPYESLGNMCYDMGEDELVDWIDDFSDTVKSLTDRKPAIYTSYAWWTTCTGNSTAFSDHDLHAAAYPYPGYEDGFDVYMYGGWENYTLWQYSSTGPFAGDSNQFHGTYNELRQFATNGFADVTTATKFHPEIMWADRHNITNGWPDGTFRPHTPINRDAMAAFLYRLAGKPTFTPPAASPFTDYPKGSKFYKEVTWLESTGITNGWPDGTFRPLESINREAMAAFLYRMAGEPAFATPQTSPFTDYPRGSKFYKAVTWLESTDITTGYDNGTYLPYEPVNRDAMAAFLYRYSTKF